MTGGALQETSLHGWHLAHGARMAAFAGWEMPLHYGSALTEHAAVRQDAGLFDVSHMMVLDLEGPDARRLLRLALANDVARLDGRPGKALYTTLLQEDGGILDDLMVYALDGNRYRLVLNASQSAEDQVHLRHLAEVRGWEAGFRPRTDWGILACQGPGACARFSGLLGMPDLDVLPRFTGMAAGPGLFIARTGYTGEDGVEILGFSEKLLPLADALLSSGVQPAGLAARDSLRLEAGLKLYGQDMDSGDTPDRSALSATVDLNDPGREFLGRETVLWERQQGIAWKLVGLVLEEGIPRHGYPVLSACGELLGTVTSGLFSPSLRRGIALARVVAGYGPGARVQVSIRGQAHRAMVVNPPFWRNGQAQAFYPQEQGQ